MFVVDVGLVVIVVEGLLDEDISVVDEPVVVVVEGLLDEDVSIVAPEVEEMSVDAELPEVSVEFSSAKMTGVVTARRMTSMRNNPKTFIAQHPSPEVSSGTGQL
ncbi:hypothetical protein [Methanospirillum lacunae]|uniref:hypothetical protein n=1 Tax=Methanospirillum lacunae TaxID=668570 RepID=UPI0015E84E46|nr:hypothetical protein [Methanospirillum lacunae]